MGGTDFHLIDLVSQRDAVRQHLKGKSERQILEWLAARGRVTRVPMPTGPETFEYESAVGRRALFFFSEGDFVFFADHTTFK